jgi:N-acetylglucosamine-6-sulfatase
MVRRSPLSLLAIALMACGAPQPAPPPARRPNILVVIADDQRADSLSCMPEMLRALGPHVVFDEHFVTTPVCCPSRASMLTGLYARDHGVLRNRMHVGDRRVGGAQVFLERGNEDHTLARWLDDAGYRTAYFGRYLHGYERLVEDHRHVPRGWDDWYALASFGYYDFQLVERPRGAARAAVRCYPTDSPFGEHIPDCSEGADETVRAGEHYSTDVLRDRMLAFLRGQHAGDEPFFAVFAPFSPHAPFLNPSRYEPSRNEFSPEAIERLRGCELFERTRVPPSYGEADISDKPAWVQRLDALDDERLDRRRRRHAVALLAIEDAVRDAMALLRELGDDRETIVIYTADNGISWGEHRWVGKNCAYEECIRVPLVVRDPALDTTRHDPSLTANLDVTATIAEYAGVGTTRPIPGASMVGLVRDPRATWRRDAVLTECWSSEGPTGADEHTAIRTERWKYVAYEGEEELYDLAHDPYELDNLIHTPTEESARVLPDLRRRLAQMRGR